MTYTKIGPLEVLIGENYSKVPFSTSVLVHGQNETALVDCGSGKSAVNYIKKQLPVKNIYLTHYHLDHVWCVNEFPDAQVWINAYDKKKLSDLLEMTKANGKYAMFGKEATEKWIEEQLELEKTGGDLEQPKWDTTLDVDMKIYPYEKSLDVAGEEMIMIHTPGHSEGNALPYFPEHGVLFIVDLDLSSFGPWYNNADCEIDPFIETALKTLEVDAEYFVTGHHKGIVHRKDYEQQLRTFLNVIDTREEKILNAVKRGVSPKELVNQYVFYFKETHEHNPGVMTSEKLGIAKHLHRLSKTSETWESYYKEFIKVHSITEEYLNYKSDPLPADDHPLIKKAHTY